MKLHSKPLNNLLHLICLNLININVKMTHCCFTGISILYLHLPKETVRAPKFVFKRLLLHIYTGLIFCHLLNFKAADRCFFLKSDQRAKISLQTSLCIFTFITQISVLFISNCFFKKETSNL